MKCSLLCLAALAAVCSASAQDWAKVRLDKTPRHLEWVTVKHDNREVKCFIGFPQVKEQATAVIVIHEIFGLSDWVRGVVDQLAEAGYIAIAPDLLSGMGPNGGGSDSFSPDAVRGKIQGLSATQVNADLDSVAAYVAKLPACNGKIAVGGFCWGGGKTFSYAAHNPEIKAGLVFYGPAPSADDMANIKAPIYGFYGGNDARISAAVPQVTEQMKSAGKRYDPVIYENAGHGFMRLGEDPGDAEKPNHDANVKAREESWKRVKEILTEI
jgi:carboxymethylenebutenolidase